LPVDLKREILKINSQYGVALNVDALAKGILNLAGTNKALRAQVNNLQNILAILNALPKSAAIYLVEKLGKLPVIQENMLAILQALPRSGAKSLSVALANTPGMQRPEVQEWLESIHLEGGKELCYAVLPRYAVVPYAVRPHIPLQPFAEMLKNPNIDVNCKLGRDEHNALMLVSFVGDADKVAHLLAAGADLNARNVLGQTALIIASGRWSIESLKLLLEAGSNVNATTRAGETALMVASKHGRLDAVKLLLEAGANPAAEDATRKSALTYAIKHARGQPKDLTDYSEVIQLLKDALKMQNEAQKRAAKKR
jgi:hypothetical protein